MQQNKQMKISKQKNLMLKVNQTKMLMKVAILKSKLQRGSLMKILKLMEKCQKKRVKRSKKRRAISDKHMKVIKWRILRIKTSENRSTPN